MNLGYPSSSEKTTPAQSSAGPISFQEAATLSFALGERVRFGRLQQKIPPEMRGMFRVTVADGAITSLILQPNNITEILHGLPLERDFMNPNHSTERGRHHPKQIAQWSGSELNTLIEGISNINGDIHRHSVDSYVRSEKQSAADAARKHGFTYVHTAPLSQLLARLHHEPRLSNADMQQLRRVAAHIPIDMQGAFMCDVSRRGAKEGVITGIGIDPMQTCDVITRELLTPLLATDSSRFQKQTFPDGSYLLRQSLRAGIHVHKKAFMLDRDDYEALAQERPANERRR